MNHNMRKRYTEEQVVELIKQAISDEYIKVGKKLYVHTISYADDNGDDIHLIILNTVEEPLTQSDFDNMILHPYGYILLDGFSADDRSSLDNGFKIIRTSAYHYDIYGLHNGSLQQFQSIIESNFLDDEPFEFITDF